MKEMDQGNAHGVGAGDNAISLHEFEVFFQRLLDSQQSHGHHPSRESRSMARYGVCVYVCTCVCVFMCVRVCVCSLNTPCAVLW